MKFLTTLDRDEDGIWIALHLARGKLDLQANGSAGNREID